MLKQRVITALVVAGLLLAGIVLLPGPWLAGLLGLVVVLAGNEWAAMAGLQRRWSVLVYTALFPLLMALAAYHVALYGAVPATGELRQLLVAACAFWALTLLWALQYPGSTGIWGSVPARLIMGVLVLVPAWLSLLWLRELEHGRWLLVYVILLVCCNDIGAYFAGRAWGNGKLLPAVSPGKTWAGFFGGLAGGLTCALVVGIGSGVAAQRLGAWLAVAGFAVLAGVLGDMIESMVKRHCGIKDSGTLLPGHGGVLDRVDSITAAAPVFALALLAAGFAV